MLLVQFTQYMAVIREMLKQMETEQQAHLTQLSKMEEQTKYDTHSLIHSLTDAFTSLSLSLLPSLPP